MTLRIQVYRDQHRSRVEFAFGSNVRSTDGSARELEGVLVFDSLEGKFYLDGVSSKSEVGMIEKTGQPTAGRIGKRRKGDEPSRKVLKAMSLRARDLRALLKTASNTTDGLPAV